MLGLDVYNGNFPQLSAFQNITGITFPLLLQAANGTDYAAGREDLMVVDQNGIVRLVTNAASTERRQQVIDLVSTLLPRTPSIEFSWTPFFESVEIGRSSSGTLTISNTGNADLSVTDISSSDSHFTVSSTSFTVAAGGHQAVAVRFNPTSKGDKSALLTVVSNDPDRGNLKVSIAGTGTQSPKPKITLSSSDLVFGDIKVDQSLDRIFSISNVGNADLSVTDISSSDSQFTVSPTAFTVAVGDSQKVRVTLSPTSPGTQTGRITIISNNRDRTVLTVSATVSNQHPMAISDTVTIRENGRINIPVVQNDTDPDGDILTVTRVTQGSNSERVVINSDGTVHYRANPGFAGMDSFEYTVNDGWSGTAVATVVVTVKAVVPMIQLSTDQLVFDGVDAGQSVSLPLRISNTGDANLFIHNIVFRDAVQFTISDTSFTIPPDSSQTVTVTFMPDARGEWSSTLVLSSNDPEHEETLIALRGKGIAIIGDFDGDGTVGFKDFLKFAQAFGGTDAQFDLNGDESVGFQDFIIFAENFGKSVSQ